MGRVFGDCLGLCWRRKAKFLVVGLENSGKTSVVSSLQVEKRPADAVPTMGFSVEKFQLGQVQLTVMDMSGQAKYRKLWECYFREVDALVFVIDAADRAKLADAKSVLHTLIADPANGRIPLLVLANKTDLVHAMSAAQVAQAVALESLEGTRPWHISACSAISGNGLQDGISWLLQHIDP
eukprot:TRINITY_DN3405_c0_g1_i1.p1 TRINITY_DN3405_c0_g1~~TRINITY_DN3405_c0_g1_i1.p1  ORF type:complete len:181 (-),score=36.50 TRINITY_DN3405_c0_g1_i1:23-565(-)